MSQAKRDTIPESGLGPQNGRWRQWVERSVTNIKSGVAAARNDTANSFKATNSSLQLLTKQIETLSGQNDVLQDMVTNLLSSGITTTNITASGDISADDISVDNITASGPIYTPHGRATPVTTNYVGAWLNSDGRIGASASAARYKQDFESANTDRLVDALLHAGLARFKYIAAVEELGEGAPLELGGIAEYFENTALSEYVYRDADGEVMGISYERLTIPLIAVVQNLDARLKALETDRMEPL